MTDKILFVDDDPNLLAACHRSLRRHFNIDVAAGGIEALAQIDATGPYAVIVADMRMPGMDGVELLQRVHAIAADTVRVMLTGNADQQTAVDAVNRGEVFRFLNKPCPPEVLIPTLHEALKQHQLVRIERELLEGTLAGSVKMLVDVLGVVSPDALGRGQRLRESIRQFAIWSGVRSTWELELGALLSQIGCTAVPPAILHRAAAGEELRPAEAGILRRVPQIGHGLLADIPRLAGVARIVLYQHKHFDGAGFPADECAGADIPLGARMLKVLNDRLDLEADGVVKQRALDTMQARAGVYDPDLLRQCFECFEAFLVNAIARDRPVLRLAPEDLLPGHVVVSDITTHAGLVLVGAANRLTPPMIERIRNFAELGEIKLPLLVQEAPSEATAIPCTSPDFRPAHVGGDSERGSVVTAAG